MKLPRAFRIAIICSLLGLSTCNQTITGGGSGLTPDCSAIEDCSVEEPECRTAVACEQGKCVFDDAIEGTLLAQQTAGDCAHIVCNGEGKLKLIALVTDLPDDADICTLDACNGSSPTHTLQAEVPCYTGPLGTMGIGACVQGIQHCDAQGTPIGGCDGEVVPEAENCMSPFDEDCDGKANEEGADCECVPGDLAACYTGIPTTENVGICHGGMKSCNADGLTYGPCIGEQTPMAEVCDLGGTDEDCDGVVNEEGPDCACGDGMVQPALGETCDDGGNLDGDDCSPTCQEQRVVEVAVGAYHGCARLNDGSVKCWGYNSSGQLGLGDGNNHGDQANEMGSNLSPVSLGAGKSALSITAGGAHACAILNDSSVKCWGHNGDGQLGLGDTSTRGDQMNEMGDNLPAVALGAGKTALAVAAGAEHTCAILNDSTVKCWGHNVYGQLGLLDLSSHGDQANEMGDNLPTVDLGTGKSAMAIAAGDGHTCAILNDSTVKCWGQNTYGKLGAGNTLTNGNAMGLMGDNLPVVALGAGKTALAIAASAEHTCALLNDGSVKCWGRNSYGQLGLGDTFDRGDGANEMGDNLPTVNLGTGKTAAAVAVASDHTCTILNDGSVKCWGRNTNGWLCLGDTSNRGDQPNEMGDNLPAVNIAMGKGGLGIDAGVEHTCARFDDGSLKCWGGNSYGQLGLGDTANWCAQMANTIPTVKLFSDLW